MFCLLFRTITWVWNEKHSYRSIITVFTFCPHCQTQTLSITMMRIMNRIQECAALHTTEHQFLRRFPLAVSHCFFCVWWESHAAKPFTQRKQFLHTSPELQNYLPLGNQGKTTQRAFGLIITWHSYTHIWRRMTAMTCLSSVCQFYDAAVVQVKCYGSDILKHVWFSWWWIA